MDDLEIEIEKLKQKQSKDFDLIEELQKYLVRLHSDILERKAENIALLKCLTMMPKVDEKKLLKTFEIYKKQAHQKLLEKIEDVDPFFATKLDNRDPEKE